MEGFTIVDAGAAVIVLLSAILAYSRGLVREVFAILGWVAAAAAAFAFARQAEPLVKQIPVLDKFLGDSCELSIIAAFAAVFAGTLILASIVTPLFGAMIQRSALSGIDQGLGFLFGVARGLLLVGVAFLVYNKLAAGAAIAAVDNSRSAVVFDSLQGKLSGEVPSDAPSWIAARYNALVGECGAPAATAPAAAPAQGAEAAPTAEGTANGGISATGAKAVTP